ncbi:sensor histidine kinase [Nannocystis pusilla]|uniref:sensor histidine kinase n=1 Tax=Nannocystis pusilla TaxID=889268 RepID=UPI003B7E5A12
MWTDAYVDPAGQGWMVSCIAPVYRGDFLEGVIGLDITTKTIIAEVLELQLPWSGYGVLIGKDGTLLALPPAGEAEWGLRELTDHSYTEHIMRDTFKPDDFNLYKRPDLAALAEKIRGAPQGVAAIDLKGPHVVAWGTAAQTGWTLLIVAPERDIYAQANSLGDRLFRIGGWMVFGLVAFYCGFLWFIARRARQISAEVVTPLLAIDGLVRRIGAGEYVVEPPPIVIAELDASAHAVAEMGRQLGAAYHEAEVARDGAQRASQLKSEFLATMSHELRTPLNIVIGMNELLREDVSDPELQRYTDAIDSAGRDLLRIVEDILDLSRIEAGHIELSTAPFDPAGLVESVVQLFVPQARSRGLHLAVVVDAALPAAIVGDQGRMRQVLFNLVGNAIKFTPRGDVVVRARRIESRLRVEVEDTGIGIPEQARERMFQLFTQVDGSYARRHGGTGLGLSVCKRLVELMGGSIGYHSEAGEGSLFWFELPLVEQAPAAEISPFAGLQARIVGASSPSRDALVATLRNLGLAVERASDTATPADANVDVWILEGDTVAPPRAVAIAISDGSLPRGSWPQWRSRSRARQCGSRLPQLSGQCRHVRPESHSGQSPLRGLRAWPMTGLLMRRVIRHSSLLAALAVASPACFLEDLLDGDSSPVQHDTIALSTGIDVAYRELGDPDGDVVIFLHGYTDTSRSFCRRRWRCTSSTTIITCTSSTSAATAARRCRPRPTVRPRRRSASSRPTWPTT